MNDLSRSRSGSRPEGRRLPSYFDLIEDELRRRGGGGGGTKKAPVKLKAGLPALRHAGAATAFSRASGNNAVVVKVLSYGAGASSARNILAYQSKEEKAHDQDGREVTDLNAAVRSWEREFANRKGSKDVLRLTYELEKTDREHVARALGALADEGFHHTGDVDRTYAFSVNEGVKGQTRLHLALVIAHEKKDRADRSSRNRIAAEIDDVHAVDVRLDKALRQGGITPASRYPAEFVSGPKGLTATFHAMQRAGAEVTLSTKAHIEERPGKSGRYQHGPERREVTTRDHKRLTAEGKIVGALMQTRQPRDFMHLLLSGPANVDRDRSRRSVGRVIQMLEGIAKDRTAPSTARELSHDLSIGLQREYRRLETAVREGRDPTGEKGEEHMLRATPINAAQAKAAKETLANTTLSVAAKITNPSDRLIFEQATKIIGKVIGLQLDSRVAKNRVRAEDGRDKRNSESLETKSAAGRDHIAEQGAVNRSSNNRTVDASRVARSNAEQDRPETDRLDRKREKTQQRDREIPKSIKLRPPQDKDRDRSR